MRRAALVKGFRTAAAVNADAANLERTSIAFRDAELMLEQLVKYTGKRIITARRAKILAIRGDLLSLESCFRLERMRLKWIETMIANCTMCTSRWDYRPRQSVKRLGQRREADPRGLDGRPSQPIFRLA